MDESTKIMYRFNLWREQPQKYVPFSNDSLKETVNAVAVSVLCSANSDCGGSGCGD